MGGVGCRGPDLSEVLDRATCNTGATNRKDVRYNEGVALGFQNSPHRLVGAFAGQSDTPQVTVLQVTNGGLRSETNQLARQS